MKKFALFLSSFLITLALIALLLNPKVYFDACVQGLKIWALTVLPALLPFIFLTLLLCNIVNPNSLAKFFNGFCKKFYHENGLCGYLQIMSFISGYPVGSKLLSEFALKGLISKNNAEKISVCTSTSGPAFIIASVGLVMLNDKKAGVILYVCHIFSALLNGVIFNKRAVYQPIHPLFNTKQKSKNLFYDCAFSTFISCLTVGVFIAFFFVFLQILQDFKVLLPLEFLLGLIFNDSKKASAFIAGLIECTKGCIMMANTKGILKLPLICSLISFGGFSVIAQSIAFLKQANISVRFFIFGKIVQTALAFIICLITCAVIGYY